MHRWFDFVVYVLMLVVLTACSKGVATSQAHVWPEKGESACSQIPTVYSQTGEISWTWLGVNIGQTTRQEVIAMLGKPKETDLWFGIQRPRFLQACILKYEINNDDVWFWVVNDIVTGVEFYDSHFSFQNENLPTTIYDLRDLYGVPELVGWTPILGPGHRTIIWMDKGIIVQTSAYGSGKLAHIFYFSPVSDSEFNYTPWAQMVLSRQPDWNSDVIDGAPRDPFHWEDWDESNP